MSPFDFLLRRKLRARNPVSGSLKFREGNSVGDCAVDYQKAALDALEISREIPDLEKAESYRRLAERYLLLARFQATEEAPPMTVERDSSPKP
jgi:hypothetical protein